MRHNKKFNHLGRKSAHRQAMLSNMASSLILHKRITTTTAKAKALKIYVEPLITKSKDDTTHARRIVFSYLQNKEAVTELFREVSGKVADRPGGYTRILRTGNRLGDNAEMCMMELVDFNEAMLAAKEESSKGRKKRSRRGGKKSEEAAPVAETSRSKKQAPAAPKEEAPAAPKAEEKPAEEPAAEAPAEEKE
ncbi:MAG: 50S ribosomal protein L17 [Bacteroidales bacterium]|jgi:large subunit ribosomal protein L17|nr:50S ribosomal protein L17 [Bacteroidales bacterium]